MVRVVSDESILTEEVKQRSLATLVRKYVEMPQPEWQKRRNDIGQQLRAAEREVAALEFSLEHAAADDDESAAMPPSPEMIGITRVCRLYIVLNWVVVVVGGCCCVLLKGSSPLPLSLSLSLSLTHTHNLY